jgi:hypothetical protein
MSQSIGRYRIIARLGPGRLGVVYQAIDPEHQRPVALRVIRRPAPDDSRGSERFANLQRAARAAVTLDHPNIAATYDCGEADIAVEEGTAGQVNAFFIASAMVDGQPLGSRLPAGTAVEPGAAFRWMTQILLALDHAHARGVVHANLKPGNVLITADDGIRLTDFGLSRGRGAGAGSGGSLLDAPMYLAPEQLLGDAVDARTDIFAAGILLYEMLAGHPPFAGGAAAITEQILARDPPPPSRLKPGLGTAFDGVVLRALARQPERRFASADQFLLALNRAMFQSAESRADATAAASPGAIVEPSETTVAAAVDGWRTTAVAPLEAALADAVGPIAPVLVRKALTGAATYDTACGELAAHIPDPSARQAFLSAAGERRHERAVEQARRATEPPIASRPAGDVPARSRGEPIDQKTLQLATASLSDEVGPMARIIVHRTAADAGSRTEFFRLLAAWIPSARKKQDFLRQFGVAD